MYEWDNTYDIWNHLLKKLREEKFTYSLPANVSESDYHAACTRLIKDLDAFTSANALDENSLSVYYVQSTIASRISHESYEANNEKVYRYAVSHKYPGMNSISVF